MVCVDKTILYLSYYLLIKKVPNICKQFANNLLVDGKLLKKRFKIVQSSEFLGKRLGWLLKIGSKLAKKVLRPLAKSALIPLALTAAVSAADEETHKKIFGSGSYHPRA